MFVIERYAKADMGLLSELERDVWMFKIVGSNGSPDTLGRDFCKVQLVTYLFQKRLTNRHKFNTIREKSFDPLYGSLGREDIVIPPEIERAVLTKIVETFHII
ncbi:hypothetical protein D3C74_49780 [compost metagenome]